MVKQICALGLIGAFLVLLLAAPAGEVLAQSATATYTPIPTRTQTAATQVITIVQLDGGVAMINRSVSYGDAFIVISVAALFALGALYWAYQWVRSHIRTQEQ